MQHDDSDGLAGERSRVTILFCGSRDWTDRETIRGVVKKLQDEIGEGPAIAIHGAARGADTIVGEETASLGFEVKAYPADWEKHGKAAGAIRNTEMLEKEKPDRVVAFLLPKSKGSWDTIMKAVKMGIQVELHFGVGDTMRPVHVTVRKRVEGE